MQLKKTLAKLLSISMVLSALSITAFIPAHAATTAAITAQKATGETQECTGLQEALNFINGDGTITIGAGTVELDTGVYIQSLSAEQSITIQGAGSGQTTIKPADPQAFIDILRKSSSTAGYYEAKRLVEIIGKEITLKGLTFDGTGIYGRKYYVLGDVLDFVPLRINGAYVSWGAGAADVKLEDVRVLRSTGDGNKGCIQIGDNDKIYSANVTADGLYIDSNSGASNYADIDICDGNTLVVTKGGFSGIVSGDVTLPENAAGYYTASAAGYTAYCTIPFILDCYENNKGVLDQYKDYFEDVQEPGMDLVNKMAADLTDIDLQLYGDTCTEKKALAQEFSGVLTGIAEVFGADVTESQKQLNAALAQEDWHTWDEGIPGSDNVTYTCTVCGDTRTEPLPVEEDPIRCTASEATTNGLASEDMKYGVRFIFQNEGEESLEDFGAYLLPESIFEEEVQLEEDAAKVIYQEGQLEKGQTFVADLLGIPKPTTIFAIPFAGGDVYGVTSFDKGAFPVANAEGGVE